MKCDCTIKNRVKRMAGQLRGIEKMMEEEKSCEEILIQLKAIRANIDKTIQLLAVNNLIQTIETNHQIQVENIDEAMKLIMKGQ